MSFVTISVIGLGYIGLPTAAMFASRKIKVIGVDVNQKTVDTINRGEIHIVEPDLDTLVAKAVADGYLKATMTPEEAEAFLIAVPTPFKPSGKGEIPEPDLTYIKSASMAIAPVLKKGDLVILESTSPVGATEKMAGWLAKERTDLSFPQQAGKEADISIAHCPERVLPGYVVQELVNNDRVIGGITSKCSKRAVELYQIFVEGECVITNSRTAEMAKLTENASRDVSIAFANELSMICDDFDIDVWELIALANRHPRVDILQPGPGVGGHCIAVDPWFIVSETPNISKLIHTARIINDSKPEWVVNKVKQAIWNFLQANPERSVSNVTVACYGLAFKANIDDLRESPSLDITKNIISQHAGIVIAIEPNIHELPEQLKDTCKLITAEEAIISADVHVLLVDHKEFIGLKLSKIDCDYLIDTKGIWK